jgi:kynurenine formamidase
VPLDQLIGPGFVIDVARQAAENVDYLVSAKNIEAFEAEHGRLPKGAMVLLNTGRTRLTRRLQRRA